MSEKWEWHERDWKWLETSIIEINAHLGRINGQISNLMQDNIKFNYQIEALENKNTTRSEDWGRRIEWAMRLATGIAVGFVLAKVNGII